ncbi:MAG TPA: glycosyltransferase family 2 protein [Pyrinomonadaceae bacterium]
MNVLGLMMVRNGENVLRRNLDSMAVYCDEIYALNDRSTDGTLDILRSHPAVTNIFSASAAVSQEDWFFSESMNLNLLYRMADFCLPDWIIRLDHDEVFERGDELRGLLASCGREVSGINVSRHSLWNDPDYPLMVPLMSPAKSLQGTIWRFYPGLESGKKRLHNRRLPCCIENLGKVQTMGDVKLYHDGWDTLAKRIEKVDQYTALDPGDEYNFGVSYDRGLLFGYERSAVDSLISDYRKKFEAYQKEAEALEGVPAT